MKVYCRVEEFCFWIFILKYLGFFGVIWERCCCVCDGKCSNVVVDVFKIVKLRLRIMLVDNKIVFNKFIFSEL